MRTSMVLNVEVPRPRADVLAWWTGFPDDYTAKDPKEQPHRIQVTSRSAEKVDILTWWRVPVVGEVKIKEVFHLHPDGNFDVDVLLDSYGLMQRDQFVFTEENGITKGRISIDIWPASLRGHLLGPVYAVYARTNYPRTFQRSAELCARDAPKVTQS